MDFASLPVADLPVPASPPASPATAVAEVKKLPLPQRLTLRPTISGKANYFDLAQTRRPPHDLRTAIIFLCMAAHDNSFWWAARAPEHNDGEDAPPLPYKLNFAAWGAYIDEWAAETFSPDEDGSVEVLALRIWIGAHETVVVPEGTQKKTEAPAPTGPNSTSTSSPAEMPPGGTSCSTACPCETSTPPSTHGSPPTVTNASVHPPGSAANLKSDSESPTP